MRNLKYFLLLMIAFTSLSLITVRTSRLSESINPGDPIPDIKELKSLSGETINLSDLKGQKVLVNFWAAYDANSRRDNVLFSKITGEEDSPIKMVSVSFDKSKSVFERTVTMDEVDKNGQYYVQENAHSAIGQLYKLDHGFKNFLIDESGTILEVDISPEQLCQHLTKDKRN